MAIRLRRCLGVGWVALCAARSVAKEGDVYLDDDAHMALTRKFWQDYPAAGVAVEPNVAVVTEYEESHNQNRDEWELSFGACLCSPSMTAHVRKD